MVSNLNSYSCSDQFKHNVQMITEVEDCETDAAPKEAMGEQ